MTPTFKKLKIGVFVGSFNLELSKTTVNLTVNQQQETMTERTREITREPNLLDRWFGSKPLPKSYNIPTVVSSENDNGKLEEKYSPDKFLESLGVSIPKDEDLRYPRGFVLHTDRDSARQQVARWKQEQELLEFEKKLKSTCEFPRRRKSARTWRCKQEITFKREV